MSGGARFCRSCGAALAPDSAFCRGCGAPVAGRPSGRPPARRAQPGPRPDDPGRRRPRRSRRFAAFVAAAAVLIAVGVGTAFVVTGGTESDSVGGVSVAADETRAISTVPETATTEASRSGTATSSSPVAGQARSPAGAIGVGSYIQAGSFRTVAGAESEQSRLEAAGIRGSVVDSDEAQELYPGFQVLIVGPLSSGARRRSLLRRLHRNGVPSAFTRSLSPALEIPGPEAIAGEWRGTLDVSGVGRPGREGPTRATLSADPDGLSAELSFPGRHCVAELSLASASDVALSFSADPGCVGAGEWSVRPDGESVALTLLPEDSEEIVTGRLRAE